MRYLKLSAVLAAAIALAPPVLAAPVPGEDITDLAEPMAGTSGKTGLDLLRQLFPDIEPSTNPRLLASATRMIDLRSIGIGDDSWIGCSDRIDLEGLAARPVQLGDQTRIIVIPALDDQCAAPLAMFDRDGKLIDAVNIKGDQHAALSGNDLRPLGTAGALVMAHNWHDNSSQSYDADSLILAKPDGFATIGNVWALGSHGCRGQFTEDARISIVPAKPMARIEAAVRREARKFAADCETPRGRIVTTTFNGSWRWDARKGAYQPHTRELDLLADWNQTHF